MSAVAIIFMEGAIMKQEEAAALGLWYALTRITEMEAAQESDARTAAIVREL
jgi:hypothetical protein